MSTHSGSAPDPPDPSDAASDTRGRAPARTGHAVRLDDVYLAYPDGTPALDGVSLEVPHGQFLSVIGPSGCGKSTLLQLVAGLLSPTAGAVQVSDPEQPDREPRIGYVFQEHRLLPWRSVRRNLEIVLQAAGVPKSEWDERVRRYLEMVRIPRAAETWPMRLSGGQRQRVAIARALIIEPSIVLMDEPFSALDEVTGQVLREELTSIWSSWRQTVIFVTHSIREAVYLSDRVVALSTGPGRVLDEVTVDIPRPRRMEDDMVVRLEQKLTKSLRERWGAVVDGGTSDD